MGVRFVLTARTKGLAERALVVRHALRNARIPLVTIVGLQIGGLRDGALVVEQIFGLQGLGWARRRPPRLRTQT
jgi:ABC-type dipeptide/oligopeptide/nickel transport system permease component